MSEKETKEEIEKEPDTSSEEEEEEEGSNQVEQETTAEPKPKKKYVFNCTKCGNCCEKREFVPISLADFRNWTQSGTINAVFPNLRFRTLEVGESEEKQGFMTLVLGGS